MGVYVNVCACVCVCASTSLDTASTMHPTRPFHFLSITSIRYSPLSVCVCACVCVCVCLSVCVSFSLSPSSPSYSPPSGLPGDGRLHQLRHARVAHGQLFTTPLCPGRCEQRRATRRSEKKSGEQWRPPCAAPHRRGWGRSALCKRKRAGARSSRCASATADDRKGRRGREGAGQRRVSEWKTKGSLFCLSTERSAPSPPSPSPVLISRIERDPNCSFLAGRVWRTAVSSRGNRTQRKRPDLKGASPVILLFSRFSALLRDTAHAVPDVCLHACDYGSAKLSHARLAAGREAHVSPHSRPHSELSHHTSFFCFASLSPCLQNFPSLTAAFFQHGKGDASRLSTGKTLFMTPTATLSPAESKRTREERQHDHQNTFPLSLALSLFGCLPFQPQTTCVHCLRPIALYSLRLQSPVRLVFSPRASLCPFSLSLSLSLSRSLSLLPAALCSRGRYTTPLELWLLSYIDALLSLSSPLDSLPSSLSLSLISLLLWPSLLASLPSLPLSPAHPQRIPLHPSTPVLSSLQAPASSLPLPHPTTRCQLGSACHRSVAHKPSASPSCCSSCPRSSRPPTQARCGRQRAASPPKAPPRPATCTWPGTRPAAARSSLTSSYEMARGPPSASTRPSRPWRARTSSRCTRRATARPMPPTALPAATSRPVSVGRCVRVGYGSHPPQGVAGMAAGETVGQGQGPLRPRMC